MDDSSISYSLILGYKVIY